MTADEMVSWPVVVTNLAWAIFRHFLGGTSDVGGNPALRILIVTLSVALEFGLLVLLRQTLLVHVQGVTRIVCAFASYAFVGIVQGGALYLALTRTSLLDPGAGNAVFRTLAGAVSAIAVIATCTLAIRTIREYRQRIAQLASEQDRLQKLLVESEVNVRAQHVNAARRIEAMIEDELIALPISSVDETLVAMESLISETVRPISHQLAVESVVPVVAEPLADDVHVSWRETMRSVANDGRLMPVPITLGAMFVGVPAMFALFLPVRALIALLVGSAALLGSLFLVQLIVGASLRRLGIASRVVVLTLSFVAATVPTVVLVPICVGPGPDEFFIRSLLVGAPALGWLVVIVASLRRQVIHIDEILRKSNASLRWAIARNHMLQWHRRGQLARALHGPVQSAVHVAISRLRGSVQNETANSESVIEMRNSLRNALAGLLNQHEDVLDLKAQYAGIGDTWAGIVDVSINIPDDLLSAVQVDPVLSAFAGDVAQEAVSNAVRHGGASLVSISLAWSDEDAVTLIVQDNGVGVNENSGRGLGSQQLDDCALEWSRGRSEGVSFLRAQLAMAAQSDQK
jgi:signal transduction histidine kinase